MSIQQLFFNASVVETRVVFTAPGNFTIPSGVTSITAKLFASGGAQNAPWALAGSGAYIIGTFPVQSGDVINAIYTGTSSSAARTAYVEWTRSGYGVLGWAIAGSGGASGYEGTNPDDQSQNYFYNGTGGNGNGNGGGGNGGTGGDTSNFGQSGGSGASYDVGGIGGDGGDQGGGEGGDGGDGSDGSAPGVVGGAPGGNGAGSGAAAGGNGGNGGAGIAGGGGGGGGTSEIEIGGIYYQGQGGAGGGAGSSGTNNMTVTAAGVCSSLTDSDRGDAGNPNIAGKVVLIY